MSTSLRLGSLISLAVALSGCASLAGSAVGGPAVARTAAAASAAAAAASSASAPAGAASAAARPEPAAPKPFAEVIKGATQQAGFVPVWRKDEKVWLEIPAERLDKPFLLSANIAQSVGERGLYGSQMGPSWLASFRRVNNQIQLIALNTEYVASGTADAGDRRAGFSDSLLAAAAVASAPHPERKSVLVDASFLLDRPAGLLARSSRRPTACPTRWTARNSSIEKTRVTDDLTTLNLRMHFATARTARAAADARRRCPLPAPPSTVPDPRSFFVGYVYSFTRLPEQPMARAPGRPAPGPLHRHRHRPVDRPAGQPEALHYVNRWRLEKADPAAALSEPKQPIVFWLDKNIPPRLPQVGRRRAFWSGTRPSSASASRTPSWSKQQPDDADWDTLDSRHASIRWFVGADVGFARGPSHSDPRTGEIIDADIAMSDVFGRGARRFIVENVGARAPQRRSPRRSRCPGRKAAAQACNYADAAAGRAGLRARPARGARRHRARQPRGRGLRAVVITRHDHARGRPHARA